jgi:hypothetical protein
MEVSAPMAGKGAPDVCLLDPYPPSRTMSQDP